MKEIKKLVEHQGTILCLSEPEKAQLRAQGYVVEETETPCGAKGNQIVSKSER